MLKQDTPRGSLLKPTLDLLCKDNTLTPEPNFYSHTINLCCKARLYSSGFQLYNDMLRRSVEPTSFVLTSVIELYEKVGDIKEARALFDAYLKETLNPSNPSTPSRGNFFQFSSILTLTLRISAVFHSLMLAYCRYGDPEEAEKIYQQFVDLKLEHDDYTYNALIVMKLAQEDISGAISLLHEAKSKIGFAHKQSFERIAKKIVKKNIGSALLDNLLIWMKEDDINPSYTMLSVRLQAKLQNPAITVEEVKKLCAEIEQLYIPPISLYNTLFRYYQRINSSEETQRLMESLLAARTEFNSETWSILILSFGQFHKPTMLLRLWSLKGKHPLLAYGYNAFLKYTHFFGVLEELLLQQVFNEMKASKIVPHEEAYCVAIQFSGNTEYGCADMYFNI